MEIFEFLKLPKKNTVYDIAKRYHDDLTSRHGHNEDSVVSPARKSFQKPPIRRGIPDFIQQLQDIIEEDESSIVTHWMEEATARVAYVLPTGLSNRPGQQKLSEEVLCKHRHGVDEGVLAT